MGTELASNCTFGDFITPKYCHDFQGYVLLFVPPQSKRDSKLTVVGWRPDRSESLPCFRWPRDRLWVLATLVRNNRLQTMSKLINVLLFGLCCYALEGLHSYPVADRFTAALVFFKTTSLLSSICENFLILNFGIWLIIIPQLPENTGEKVKYI